MKIYAKELYIEDTSLYYEIIEEDEYYNDVFIYGNRDFKGLNSGYIKELFDDVLNYSMYELESDFKNNIASYIIYYVKRIFDIKLNVKKALMINRCITEYETNSRYYNQYECIKDILSIIYRKEYDYTCMRGYSQSDWQYIIYPCEKEKDIRYIEAVYFGTGKEIMIHDEDKTPLTPEDISGYTLYTELYNEEEIKELISKECNCNINDVIYYSISDVKYRRVIDIEYKEA